MGLRISVLAALVCVAASLVLVGSAEALPLAAQARAGVHELEGRVASVNRPKRTFRLVTRSRGTVRIHVTRSTRYEDLRRHFRSLHRGLRVEVKARRVHARWRAVKIDREDRDND